MISKFLALLGLIALPISASLFANSEQLVKDNTYKLSQDGSFGCQIPLVDTEIGALTAAHCIEGQPTVIFGLGPHGEKKKFKLHKKSYTFRGLDYALYKSNKPGPIKLGNSKNLQKGDEIFFYSHAHGLKKGHIIVVPDRKYDFKTYIDIGSCGDSGSGVFNKNGELIGIFVALTWPNYGVMMPIDKILSDIG